MTAKEILIKHFGEAICGTEITYTEIINGMHDFAAILAIEFAEWIAMNDDWIFGKDKVWRKYGWRDRSTNELYELFLKSQDK